MGDSGSARPLSAGPGRCSSRSGCGQHIHPQKCTGIDEPIHAWPGCEDTSEAVVLVHRILGSVTEQGHGAGIVTQSRGPDHAVQPGCVRGLRLEHRLGVGGGGGVGQLGRLDTQSSHTESTETGEAQLPREAEPSHG